MTYNIQQGISKQLSAEYDGIAKVYFSKDVSLETEPPYFFISHINTMRYKVVGDRYREDNSFIVRYVPLEKENKQTTIEVATQLFLTLEYITLLEGSMLHGVDMRFEISDDGMLHFYVNYNTYLHYVYDYDTMKTLEIVYDI